MDETVLSCCGPDYIHTSIFSCQVAMLDWMTCRLWRSLPFYRSVFEKMTFHASFFSFSLYIKSLLIWTRVRHVLVKKSRLYNKQTLMFLCRNQKNQDEH